MFLCPFPASRGSCVAWLTALSFSSQKGLFFHCSSDPRYYDSVPLLEQLSLQRAERGADWAVGTRHAPSQARPVEASGDARSLGECVSHGWLRKYEPLHLAHRSFLKSCCKSFVSPAPDVTALITLDCDCLGPSPPLDWEPSRAGVPGVAQCSVWPSGAVRWIKHWLGRRARRFPLRSWLVFHVLVDDSALLCLQTPPNPN